MYEVHRIRISHQDFPDPNTHNIKLPCLDTVESELEIGWAICGWFPYMLPRIAPAKIDSRKQHC